MSNDQRYWEQGNGISAQEGAAVMTVDGRNYPIFYITSCEAKIKKNKKELKVVGRRGTGNKTIGWSGSGTLSIARTTSYYTSLFLDYVQNGVDVYFSLSVSVEDSNTPFGRETITLLGCNFDEETVAMLKPDDFLTTDLPFTFEGIENPETFKED